MEAVGEAAGEAPECAFAERCSRCMAAAEPASEEAYSQLRLRVRHLVQGFCSSHLTRALAQAWQAWATRPAPGDELMRRFLLPLPLSSWLARCLLSRSARPKAFRQTWAQRLAFGGCPGGQYGASSAPTGGRDVPRRRTACPRCGWLCASGDVLGESTASGSRHTGRDWC